MPNMSIPGQIVEHSQGASGTSSGDTLLGETTIGGPLCADDVRMMLDRATLRRLLEYAESSLSGRVVLHGVGFKQRVWRTKTGHVYQTLSLVSQQPKPERVGFSGVVEP